MIQFGKESLKMLKMLLVLKVETIKMEYSLWSIMILLDILKMFRFAINKMVE